MNFEKCLTNINYRLHFIILVSYSLLSVMLTYPVAFSKNEIPGGGDAYYYLWDFWWFKSAIFNLANPYYTNYIYYPSGVYMWFADNAPLDALFSIPLQQLFGLIKAYNIIWILTFIFSGYAMFSLVKYLTNNSMAAFISGLIFMFSPYRFAHALGHMNLISTIWIPLYILFFLKLLKEPKMENIFILSGILLLNVLSSYYYVVFLLTFSTMYIIFYYIYYQNNKINIHVFKRIMLFLIISGIICSPLLYPMIKALLFEKASYMYAYGFVMYSADLIGFFIPSIFHPIFKDFVSGIYSNFEGNPAEYTVFVGYSVLLLSILAVLKIKSKEVIFWAICAMIFLILSLGPLLHINGLFSFMVEEYSVYLPLPYSILMRIPIFSLARVPSRWDILLMLSLSILAGYTLEYLSGTFRSYMKNLLYIIVSGMILLEFLSVPYPMASADVPVFYQQLAVDKEDYAIMEIPKLGDYLIAPNYLYYQTVHGKKLIGGYVGRAAVEPYSPILDELWNTEIQRSNQNEVGIFERNLSNIYLSILDFYDVKYIILHKDGLSSEQVKFKMDQFALMNLSSYLYKNDSMIVYRVPLVDSNLSTAFFTFKDGWHEDEYWNNVSTKWMQDTAKILIWSNEGRNANLSLSAASFYHDRTLEIYCEKGLMVRAKVPSSFIDVQVPIHLEKGTNIVRLDVPEGCERPCDISGLKNPDSRCLSIAVQNITIA